MTVIEFAGISDFIGCDQKYENSYSEVLRFKRKDDIPGLHFC